MFRTRTFVLVLSVSALMPSVSAATEDAKAVCADAYERSQRLKMRGALQEARKALLLCSQDPCPSVMHSDCAKWLAEVEAITPTIVLRVTAEGTDVVDARVAVDGTVVTERLDGLPIRVDPGEHEIRVLWNGRIEKRTVLVSVGERERRVEVFFDPPAPKTDVPANGTTTRPIPWTAYATAGLSLVAFGSFALFGLDAKNGLDELDARGCRPFCDRSDVDAVNRSTTIADVSLVVGLVAALATAVIIVTRPSHAVPHASR